MNDTQTPKPAFWRRMGRAIWNIFRLLIVLVIIGGVVIAVYLGTPFLYEKIIRPVETNTERLTEIEDRLISDTDQLANQVSEMQSRLADIETRQTRNAQTIAEMQGYIEALDIAVAAHDQNIQLLLAIQDQVDELVIVSSLHESLLIGEGSIFAELQRQVALSRSTELLSRARLYLSQSNFGIARQDVEAARDLLVSLQPEMPADKAGVLRDVIARLDMALGNLPDFPVIAANDVNIAWQLLVYGLPTEAIEMPLPEPITATFTPEPITETPTPEGDVETPTPSPEGEFSPTATP